MTGFDDFGSGEYYNDWSAAEQFMWDNLTSGNDAAHDDVELQFLYDAAYFSPELFTDDRIEDIREQLREEFEEYFIDFDSEFDWDAYREWYESQ